MYICDRCYMSPLFETRPGLVAFAAALGIMLVAMSVGYYLNLLIACVWGMHVITDEYDDFVSSRYNQSNRKFRISRVSETSTLLDKPQPTGKILCE